MFSAQRQERLLAELRGQGAVRVRDLAREFGVSELTVRRDIAALAEQGLVSKVHGGATLPSHGTAVTQRRQAPLRFAVGMVVPSLDFYWPPVVAGARVAAAALGVSIQLRGSNYDAKEDRRQMRDLVEAQQVQGLLLAPSLDGDDADEILEWIGHLPVPTILVERQPRRWTPSTRHIEWVRSDHSLGIEIAIYHLRRQGHRRIGLVVAQGSPTSVHLRHAWRTAAADPTLSGVLAMEETAVAPGGRDVMDGILRNCRLAGVTALIVHSDLHAITITKLCTEMGIDIPGDLAIVSYDDEIAHLADPAITAVRPPKGHVGRLAVELMVSRLLHGVRRPPQRVLLAPDLVVRGSSLSFTQRH
ncbi:substrate-binding domain-containing protein [Micromonospora inaquosa]|uniref:substrate-binding domain-containing protein n=1 Tax=Micromonospora inaquosa TaxID=2203716 RepID=UPI001FC9A383|nr:substrate-binding domain-containing protein [Micromonospora inaquosa]